MSLAYFPLYPDRYEADTAHLSIIEDGAYNRLLRLCWRCPQCKMPDDDAWIYRQMRANSASDKSAVDRVLAEFFKRGKGKVWNPKLLEIYAQISVAHFNKSEAGKRGAAAKALKKQQTDASSAKATLKQPEPEPEPKEERGKPLSRAIAKTEPERFEEFWAAYPHRGGVKRKRSDAEARYRRVVQSGTPEQDLIDAAMRHRSDRRVVDGFARDPTTWLNQRGWLDDIEPQKLTEIRGDQHGKPARGEARVNAFVAGARGAS